VDVEAWMETLQAVVSAARTVRSEHDIDKKAEVPVRIRSGNPEVVAFLRGHVEAIRQLVKTAGDPVFEAPGGPRDKGTTVSVVAGAHGPIEVLVTLKGLVDPKDELARIERELKKLEKDLGALEKKLASPGFVDRAPPEVVEESRKQRATMIDAKARLEESRKLVEEL
jgi:valyl-tRNA synthetase